MRHLLRGIYDLADLRTLVRVAGHTPCYQELPTAALGADYAVEQVALLGTRAGFEWLGVTTEGQAPGIARRLASAFARAGRLAAILVLDRRDRVLVASVSFGGRPLLFIDLENPSTTALHCLARLEAHQSDGGVAAAARVEEAFTAEAVGRRFFIAFRRALGAMVESLPDRVPKEERHRLALLQLTRLLFLYFVQAKGWLDSRPRFLREELDQCLGNRRSVHHDFLRPLFFGTLNQPASSRGAVAKRFGRIPFLNGGLFDPHPLEQGWGIEFSNDIWREAFDGLFERFHFTPKEGGGGRDEVAPDMLGRVFEGVMDPEERGESGTYYTPIEMVDALVHAGLTAHVSTVARCPEPEAERRLAEPDATTRASLATITILDPAVGSGGFLLRALVRLADAAGGDDVQTRRRVLSRNLFGVDLNPTAVRLAELRLWLALIEADPSESPDQVDPLPNLDSIVRQGDSLFDPMPPTWSQSPSAPQGARMRAQRFRLQQASGRAKRAAVHDLRVAEAAVFDGILSEAAARTRTQIEDLVSQGRSMTLFGDRRGLRRSERKVLDGLRSRRRFLLRQKRRLVREGVLPWFHYQTHFSEVFSTSGGFDLVVGNPPWIRGESLPVETRRQLAGRYRWWSVERRTTGYAHLPDVAVAFLQRAVELASPTGTVAFLVPAKLATAAYAGTAREAIGTETTLSVVAELSDDPRASFDATTYPMALVTRKGKPRAGHVVRRHLGSHTPPDMSQSRLREAPWVLAPDGLARIADRMRAAHPPIRERFTCHLGVKTGLNRVFLDPEVPVEPELLCWALGGRDIKPFQATPSRRLLWTHDAEGRPLKELPPLARRYLEAHHEALRSRSDLRSDPLWTIFRVAGATAPHRVVWADIARRLEAAALSGPNGEWVIPLNSCYVIGTSSTSEAHALAVWLNSTWLRALASLTADPASAGFRRFNARVVADLPLPDDILKDPRILTLGQEGRCGRASQPQLDEACNHYFGLAAADRRALEGLVPGRPETGC